MTETFINIQGSLVDASKQPPYPHLQEAFRIGNNGIIVIDMPAAREVAKNMLRAERKTAFDKNDAATIRAMQARNDDALNAAAATGEMLRNITSHQSIVDAKTPDELLTAVNDLITQMRAI
jgi:hypothetical protein